MEDPDILVKYLMTMFFTSAKDGEDNILICDRSIINTNESLVVK